LLRARLTRRWPAILLGISVVPPPRTCPQLTLSPSRPAPDPSLGHGMTLPRRPRTTARHDP
jgi:hypothetical protein